MFVTKTITALTHFPHASPLHSRLSFTLAILQQQLNIRHIGRHRHTESDQPTSVHCHIVCCACALALTTLCVKVPFYNLRTYICIYTRIVMVDHETFTVFAQRLSRNAITTPSKSKQPAARVRLRSAASVLVCARVLCPINYEKCLSASSRRTRLCGRRINTDREREGGSFANKNTPIDFFVHAAVVRINCPRHETIIACKYMRSN